MKPSFYLGDNEKVLETGQVLDLQYYKLLNTSNGKLKDGYSGECEFCIFLQPQSINKVPGGKKATKVISCHSRSLSELVQVIVSRSHQSRNVGR